MRSLDDLLNPHMWDLWENPGERSTDFWEGYEEWLDQVQPEAERDGTPTEGRRLPDEELPF